MKSKGILQEISDLLLKNSFDNWFKEPSLRSLWYVFIIYAIIAVVIGIIVMFFPVSDILSKTENGVLIYRIFMSFFDLGGLILMFVITFHYYKFTIEKGNSIDFNSVLFFYVISTTLFGLLYYFVFYANPNLFKYDPSRISWIPVMGSRDLGNWANKLYFYLYSAFVSVGGNFVYVETNSVIVSLINFAQTLYSFSLVSLLIAGFINQKTNKSAYRLTSVSRDEGKEEEKERVTEQTGHN